MIAHMLKMVWNRKRWNALILIEIFLSFLVLFAVMISALTLYNNSRHPLGFDYEDVWYLSFGYPPNPTSEENREETFAKVKQIEGYLNNQPEVISHAMINTPPYSGSNWSDTISMDDRKVRAYLTYAGTGFADSLDLEVSEGRWFTEQDVPVDKRYPLVVNRRLADDLFPGKSPVGLSFTQQVDRDDPEKGMEEYHIIGVVEHFRKEGLLRKPRNFGFLPLVLEGEIGWLPSKWMLEVTPSAGAVFEERLVKDLARLAPDFSVTVTTMSRLRSDYLASETKNLKIMSVLAFFMLGMVAMGLVGVLWQHVTRRTVELGVRRAKGATRSRIYQQIAGEFLVVASFALLLGLLLVLQMPLIGWFKGASTGVMMWAFISSAILIYLLTTASALYPGWLATRVSPAEALHYE